MIIQIIKDKQGRIIGYRKNFKIGEKKDLYIIEKSDENILFGLLSMYCTIGSKEKYKHKVGSLYINAI